MSTTRWVEKGDAGAVCDPAFVDAEVERGGDALVDRWLVLADGLGQAGQGSKPRSTNVTFEQAGFSQYNRRTERSITTGLPPTASSATCRTYRECTHDDRQPHSGQAHAIPSRV
nr:hypothetical protein [Streptomyces polyasparticus]